MPTLSYVVAMSTTVWRSDVSRVAYRVWSSPVSWSQLELCGEPALDRAVAPAEEGVPGGPLARRAEGDFEAVECSGNDR